MVLGGSFVDRSDKFTSGDLEVLSYASVSLLSESSMFWSAILGEMVSCQSHCFSTSLFPWLCESASEKLEKELSSASSSGCTFLSFTERFITLLSFSSSSLIFLLAFSESLARISFSSSTRFSCTRSSSASVFNLLRRASSLLSPEPEVALASSSALNLSNPFLVITFEGLSLFFFIIDRIFGMVKFGAGGISLLHCSGGAPEAPVIKPSPSSSNIDI
nr:hypothetical protein Iba_chr14aCG20340 [Ipomoea batatas]